MNASEAYDYYYGDDSIDELAKNPNTYEDDYEYAEEMYDINPDNLMEYQIMAQVQAEEKAEAELERMKDPRYREILRGAEERRIKKKLEEMEKSEGDIPF